MRTSDFNYYLPPERIAQQAIEPRDHARLMVLHRSSGSIEHRYFYEITDYLLSGDVLICNDSRVIPARLLGNKIGSGARIELFLLRRLEVGIWESLARPARRLSKGTRIIFGSDCTIEAVVLDKRDDGIVIVHFSGEDDLERIGKVPLPPYIRLPLRNAERYQTVYSKNKGSVAAPTAGLHFTPELMDRIESRGVKFVFVTLHLALDSFRPVSEDDPSAHAIHKEYGVLTSDAVKEINAAKARGNRVVCVGTSSMRVLEQGARIVKNGITPFSDWTDLFILPGHNFQIADAMITNFHLPCSTLLMLVSAFAGRNLILEVYEEAIRLKYRFYSFGDAMLIL